MGGIARSANARCSPHYSSATHHLIRDGQVLLADKGFAGKDFKQLIDAMGLRLLRPDRVDNGICKSTAYDYLHEGINVLAVRTSRGRDLAAEVWDGAKGLFSWGPPPPPSFLRSRTSPS